ncbi:MAG TPA: right-handed parallel beta-helix repeat-containing protein [Terriglobales bacterium]|nr:right-handed parallel beta-helix repeat-containing protein [Terriglobales bacterium]
MNYTASLRKIKIKFSNISKTNLRRWPTAFLLIAYALVGMGLSSAALAATLCVNTGGSGGCYSTISAAVAAAHPKDTIKVSPGTYAEDVIIDKSISLVGVSRGNTIIDATGLANGIYVDGLDNPGLNHVLVSGFTVKNADFEGILIANSAYVTVSVTNVFNNDLSLSAQTGTCPGLPVWETAEGFDCGEGVHLSGATYSIITNNRVYKNSGGILLSDDTGATHHNVISNNIVHDNPTDCGITLASHPPAALTGSPAPLGVHHNTISANNSYRNGLGLAGAGAGVGLFTSVPGAKTYSNVVIGNSLTNNGLPGVSMHSHTPGQNLNNNSIIKNHIAGNHADTDDSFTPGPTGINVFGVSPIRGTIITQNTIENEAIDVVANTPATVTLHLNNLLGAGKIGVDNLGTGKVDATQNWWGCFGGPTKKNCSSVSGPNVLFTPWLNSPFTGQ